MTLLGSTRQCLRLLWNLVLGGIVGVDRTDQVRWCLVHSDGRNIVGNRRTGIGHVRVVWLLFLVFSMFLDIGMYSVIGRGGCATA